MKAVSSFGRHRGAALLLLFLVLFVSGSSVLLAAANKQPQLRDSVVLRSEMGKARDALLAYAVTFPENQGIAFGPGRLPCPDTDNDGGPDAAPCAGLGRLPVTELLASGSRYRFSDFGRGTDQHFWYAVSSSFNASASMVNGATASALTLDGAGNDGVNDIVALIVAPGEPHSGQSRPGNNASSYLEEGNAGGIDFVFSNAAGPENFNDSVLPVTRRELMSLVTSRVAHEMARELNEHYNLHGSFPISGAEFQAALAGAQPDWLLVDGWDLPAVTNYTPDPIDPLSRGHISFSGCSIIFTVTHDQPIQRTGAGC